MNSKEHTGKIVHDQKKVVGTDQSIITIAHWKLTFNMDSDKTHFSYKIFDKEAIISDMNIKYEKRKLFKIFTQFKEFLYESGQLKLEQPVLETLEQPVEETHEIMDEDLYA